MAKWFGKIGYYESVETAPGVWVEQIVEHTYYGNLVTNNRRFQSTDQVNETLAVSNTISIVADPYANLHFHSMKYVTLNGVKWKISNIEVNFPRLTLTLGGIYNG